MDQTPTLSRDRPFREVLDELAKGDFIEAEGQAGPEAMEAPVVAPATHIEHNGVELSSLSMFVRNSNERTLFTFIELEGYPILRITMKDEVTDLILNNDQVKLLLRQMTLWLTR